MSFGRKIQRTNAKKEFKTFVKQNPQFKAMTFNSFSKLVKKSAKIEKSVATEKEHVHSPDCNHENEDVFADMIVDASASAVSTSVVNAVDFEVADSQGSENASQTAQ